jgi:dihydroflavonol-4-reductase
MQDSVLRQAHRFNSVVVAPAGVFGEGDSKPTTGRLLVDIARGRMPITLQGRMNVVDVRTVAWGIVRALEQGRKGRVYVLGGENVTIPGFTARVARIAGATSPKITLNPDLVWPLAWANEYIANILKRSAPWLPVVGVDFARHGEYMSSETAHRDLGYDPSRSRIDQAVRRALAWFRQNGHLPSRLHRDPMI